MSKPTSYSHSSRPSPSPPSRSTQNRSSSYFTYPITYAVSGVLRRLNADDNPQAGANGNTRTMANGTRSNNSIQSQLRSTASALSQSLASFASNSSGPDMHNVFQPPHRTASPFQPPPLTPLTLKGYAENTVKSPKLLTRALAEEIRLLVPPRLQLVDQWSLAYDLLQNGSSLGTLYQKSDALGGQRGGFVLVVQDNKGAVFGAYLSDAPKPKKNARDHGFYGTGECFLWRAHVLSALPDLADLPPPPSADTTHATRMTTIAAPKLRPRDALSPPSSASASRSGTSTPDRIRFQAFMYTSINDFMIYCTSEYMSIGSG
jgi:hypothetical protein